MAAMQIQRRLVWARRRRQRHQRLFGVNVPCDVCYQGKKQTTGGCSPSKKRLAEMVSLAAVLWLWFRSSLWHVAIKLADSSPAAPRPLLLTTVLKWCFLFLTVIPHRSSLVWSQPWAGSRRWASVIKRRKVRPSFPVWTNIYKRETISVLWHFWRYTRAHTHTLGYTEEMSIALSCSFAFRPLCFLQSLQTNLSHFFSDPKILDPPVIDRKEWCQRKKGQTESWTVCQVIALWTLIYEIARAVSIMLWHTTSNCVTLSVLVKALLEVSQDSWCVVFSFGF